MTLASLQVALCLLAPTAENLIPAMPEQVEQIIDVALGNIRSIPGYSFSAVEVIVGYPDETQWGESTLYANQMRFVRFIRMNAGTSNEHLRETWSAFNGPSVRLVRWEERKEKREILEVYVGDVMTVPPCGEDALMLMGVTAPIWERGLGLFDFLVRKQVGRLAGLIDEMKRQMIVKATWTETSSGQVWKYNYQVRIDLDPPHRILEVDSEGIGPKHRGGTLRRVERFAEIGGVWYPVEVLTLSSGDDQAWRPFRRTTVTNFRIRTEPIDFSDIDAIEKNPRVRLTNHITGEQRSGKTKQEMLAFARKQVQDTRALVAGQEDVGTPPTVLATTASDPWTWVPIVASAVVLVLLLGFAWHQRRYSR